MCAGTIVQFGIPRVVIADVTNASSAETVTFMRSKGVEIVLLDPGTSPAAKECIALTAKFRKEKPDLWLEDWGGGPNAKMASRK
jgi:cytosine deaminase